MMKKLAVTGAGRENGYWVLYMECSDGAQCTMPCDIITVRALVSNGIIESPPALPPVTNQALSSEAMRELS